jgi:hypothetical protein
MEHRCFEVSPERTSVTYRKHTSIEDGGVDFHYWTIFVKFELGTAYNAARGSAGDIECDGGVALVKRFDRE